MSHHGDPSARILGFPRLASPWERVRGLGGPARRRRRGHKRLPEIDCLETRTLMSVSVVPLTTPSAAQEILNVQIRPGSAGVLSQLTPFMSAAGATAQATTVPGLYELQVPAANAGPLAQELAANPAVEYSAPQQMEQIQTAPNDPNYVNGFEWQLNSTWGINVPGAWSVTTGSDEVIVADTDTGIAYNNPDLYDNVWINQAEIPSTVLPNLTDVNNDGVITFSDLNAVVNGVAINQGPGKIEDTNGDGIITATDVLASTGAGGWASGSTQDGDTAHPDDLIGWNFVSNNNNPSDGNGHGTFTAGEIGAVTNNGIGVAGTVWNAQIMPVQFLDSTGNGSDTAAAAAIEYAVNHGAKVINASWGGAGTDPTIAAAIQYADSAGVIIVAAAGNNDTDDDNSSTWFSPASYSVDYPNLISVAATDNNGELASFSNYGVESVQLAAPGLNVYGVYSTGGYGDDSGTSMAAPLVTGTIALVEAAHPSWSMSQVIDAVLDTTTPDPNLVGKVSTGGIVNATAAVANTDGPYVVSGTPDGSVNNGSGISSLVLDFNEEINPATFTPSQVTLTGPNGAISGVTVTAVSTSNDHQFTISFPEQTGAGAYTLKVAPTLQDWYGNDLNQNRNGVNGETTDAFTETIRQTVPGSTDLLSVTGIPNAVTAGTAETVSVTALSPNGGTDTSYMGTIDFSSTDSQAGLPASYTFSKTDDGTHTFTVTFKTAGPQAITATDSGNGAIIGTEENIIVQAAAATSLEITGMPATVTTDTPQTFTVSATDAYGNVATGYAGTVSFTSSNPLTSVSPSSFAFYDSMGTSTFSVTFGAVGTQSITATDVATSSINGSASVTVNGVPAATFIKQDSTTEGNWIGAYGTQGYDVIENAVSLPGYATVTPSGESSSTGWPANTTDPRALQTAGGGSRIAACWYSATSFTVDVNLTDGQTHDLELYFLDWDKEGRSEQVQISNAATGAVLDTETVSSFSSGAYLQWEVSGHVLITFTNLAGKNAVLSGLFLDPQATSAKLIKTDTTTEGSWIEVYGTQGYDVIENAESIPAYAAVNAFGESSSTSWPANTTDPRALQTAGGGSRIAACWYSATSFTVDVNLTDGQTHDLELYFLDWDKEGRSEQVQISNAATGAVLDTETVSSFSSGVYLQWVVSGNIVIKFTNLAGKNAVLSGLFLDPSGSTPTTSATLIKTDTTTQGSWIGVYGTQGYDVIENAVSLPGYATVTPSGESSSGGWPANTTDPRALQTAGGGSRIAACWYSATSFTVDVNLTDGQTHDLELYFLDWDKEGRSEQVQISNAATGAVLDTETVSSFSSGAYLQWAVSGNIVIKFTNLAGKNAVLSGLFLDPNGSTQTTSATLIKTDTTTEGNWIGAYGTQGYDVIENAESLPSYASLTASGESSSGGWPANTTDPRALQTAGGGSRIAACWYSATSFTVDLNVADGQTHDLALYFLDWDKEGRSEQVQISNAATGAVLDTETVSSFSSGVYLQWAISGSVVIKFTNLAGKNAVVSGLFFDPNT